MSGESGQNLKSVISDKFNFFSIAKGIFLAYIITIPMFLLFAYILTYTNYPQKLITPVVLIITAVSILVAGSSVTRAIRSKGWQWRNCWICLYVFPIYCE